MAVAELAVVKHLETAAHAVVPYGEGVDRGVGVLDAVSQQRVEAILIHAFSRGGAAEAAQAAAFEVKIPDVHKAGLVGIEGGEVLYHGPEALVPLPQVPDDDGVKALLFHPGLQALDIGGGRGRTEGRSGLIYPVFHAVDQVTQKVIRILLALGAQQVLHTRGQAVDHVHAHVVAVVLDEAMGGDIVKVHGGAQLAHIDIPEVRPAALHKLDEAVELGGDKKGIHRIGKKQQPGGAYGLHRPAHVPFKALYSGAHVEKIELMGGKTLLQIQHGLQGDAVFPPGGTVDDAYLHSASPVSPPSRPDRGGK